MCIVIDIILSAVFVVSIFLGWRRGFIRSVMYFVSFVLAIIVAVVFAPKLSPVYENRIEPLITEAVSGQIDEISENEGTVIVGKVVDEVAGVFGAFIDKLDLATDVIPEGTISVENSAEQKDEIVNDIAGPIAEKISYTLSFVTLFLAAIIALKIITHILDSVFKLPFLKGINKSIGLIFGVLIGLVWVYVLAVTLVAVFPLLTSVRPDIFSFDLNDSIIIGLINAFTV